jgi:REP element-mobilizing transposase RayT
MGVEPFIYVSTTKREPMPIAYHAIFGAYGFWLPNDPRGSLSKFVSSRELFRFGKATPVDWVTSSTSRKAHNVELRVKAKEALKYPPVVFNGIQARAVGRGFRVACEKSGYEIWACAILPEHVHVVVRRHAQQIERIVGHLKGRATQQLLKEGLHPLAHCGNAPSEPPPSVWCEKCWKVALDDDQDVRHAIAYVQRNPVKEGKKAQLWSFVKRYGAGQG